jgi:hypothetical protein
MEYVMLTLIFSLGPKQMSLWCWTISNMVGKKEILLWGPTLLQWFLHNFWYILLLFPKSGFHWGLWRPCQDFCMFDFTHQWLLVLTMHIIIINDYSHNRWQKVEEAFPTRAVGGISMLLFCILDILDLSCQMKAFLLCGHQDGFQILWCDLFNVSFKSFLTAAWGPRRV